MVETDLNEVVTLAREAFPGDYPLSNSAAVTQFFREWLKSEFNFFCVGAFLESCLVSYLVWFQRGGIGQTDVVEYLQTATVGRVRKMGLGRLITVVGRELLNDHRTRKLNMPRVRFAYVSTAFENVGAQTLYRKWLLDPQKVFTGGFPNVFFGHNEVVLGGEVLPLDILKDALRQKGYCEVVA
jgi:hypothetical protein